MKNNILSFIMMLVIFVFNIECKAAQSDDYFLKTLFEYSENNEIKALEALKEEVEARNNNTITIAYSLALYIVSPEKYEDQFVEIFPLTNEGIMEDLYGSIELKRYTPKFLFSIVSIGKIAERGNNKAIYKVLNGFIHSDGVVAEQLQDCIIKLFKNDTKKTLNGLSLINKEKRKLIYNCFEDIDCKTNKQIKNNIKILKRSSEEEKNIIQEIEKYLN